MTKTNVWTSYDEKTIAQVNAFSEGYKEFISKGKTERLCVALSKELAEKKGFENLDEKIKNGTKLKAGDKVNVERSMVMNGRLDGHIVQGHVDMTAECVGMRDADGSTYFTFKYGFDKEMARRGYFTVDKGSVTVNGVSLTVCAPTDDTFTVAIIPYTFENTNFSDIKVGSKVNIEFDILGKYIARLSHFN